MYAPYLNDRKKKIYLAGLSADSRRCLRSVFDEVLSKSQDIVLRLPMRSGFVRATSKYA
jgi:hypothetical protein